jgi:AraC-like DNA-binding protein
MTSPKLDRLSALLQGLAPQVQLSVVSVNPLVGRPCAEESPFLRIYLLKKGTVQLKTLDQIHHIQSPALISLRSDQDFELTGLEPQHLCPLMAAETRFVGPIGALFLEEFQKARIISLDACEPSLDLTVAMIEVELKAQRCGHPALLKSAGDILFIGLLRHMVTHPLALESGIFNGLADPRIAKALVAFHQDPDLDWSLDRLAQEAGMSRTAFASKFRQVMGATPGAYMRSIRLAMAQNAVEMGKGLKAAARLAGYANASALSRALSKTKK